MTALPQSHDRQYPSPDSEASGHDPIRQVLAFMAAGRVVLGVLGRISPRSVFRIFGAGSTSDPLLHYITRVFGIRAVVLGVGYLASRDGERRQWQRLAFVCDMSDTIAGAGDLMRQNAPRRFAAQATLLTGLYAAVGGVAFARPA